MMLPRTPLRDPARVDATTIELERAGQRPLSLNDRRLEVVMSEVRAAGGTRVVDLGCGGGRLLLQLADEAHLEKICGVDVSRAALERSAQRLERELGDDRHRVELIHGFLTCPDARLVGYDVATVIEVIEHLALETLEVFTAVVFGYLRPRHVIVTTPNIEYNVHLDNLPPSGLRHRDHRFEWTRAEFARWADRAAFEYGYGVRYAGIGAAEVTTGSPTQMAVFSAAPGPSAMAMQSPTGPDPLGLA